MACAAKAEMREFMDYVHSAFYNATGWDGDNSYAALNSTPDGKKNKHKKRRTTIPGGHLGNHYMK